MAVGKKLRFEIFKRDGFVCTYCGAHPPDVVLECDHIIAVAAGGSDDEDNLTTACFNCNRGKREHPLTTSPMPLNEKAALVAEREEQLRGYQEIMAARRERIENEAWDIVQALTDQNNTFNRNGLMSIKKFLERLGFDEVLEAAEIARSRKPYHESVRFRYFCGVCWKKIKDAAGEG